MTNPKNKQSGSNTTKRQWQLLAELQRKRWTGTKSLQNKLKHAGFDISLRTIQRDLNQLAERFPIENNGENPQGWRWTDEAPQQNLPQMSLSEAVAFHLVEENLRQILPSSFLQEMRPWFSMAKSQLAGNEKTGRWLNSIRIVPATQPLIGPSVRANVQDVIYEGLMQGKQITASYRPASKELNSTDNLKRYKLNPIALVQRGVVLYLISTKADAPDDGYRMFALHRFESCTLQTAASSIPDDFNLDDYLDKGELGFRHPALDTSTTKVQLTFTGTAGKSLLENRLSLDQETHVDDATGHIHITATVALTFQLVWWLRGFGKGLLEIQPHTLAQAVWEGEC